VIIGVFGEKRSFVKFANFLVKSFSKNHRFSL